LKENSNGTNSCPTAGLLSSLADNWWLLLLRGVPTIAFGILAFFWPGLTLLTLTLLWGMYALADGLLALWAAIAAKGDMAPRWWLGLTGVVGVLAGLVASSILARRPWSC